jgi:hypothetical protein
MNPNKLAGFPLALSECMCTSQTHRLMGKLKMACPPTLMKSDSQTWLSNPLKSRKEAFTPQLPHPQKDSLFKESSAGSFSCIGLSLCITLLICCAQSREKLVEMKKLAIEHQSTMSQ